MRLSPFHALCVTGFLAILSTTMAKNPVLPLFAVSLGAGPEGVGFVSMLSPLAGVLVGIPAGICSDALGRRRMLLLSSVVFATAPFVYLLVTSVPGLAAARFYHGLATGVFMPVAQAAVADVFKTSRGERLGTFSSATMAGRFLAPMLGGAVLWGGFGAVYALCGLAGVGVMLLAWRLPPLEEGECPDRPGAVQGLRELLRHRGLMAGCLLEAGLLFAYGSFEAFLPLVAQERGYPAWITGLLFSIQIVATALTRPFFGRVSDRRGRRLPMLAGAVLMAAACAAMPFAAGLAWLFACSLCLGLSLSIAMSSTSAYVADLSRRGNRGAAMGILGSVMDIGHSTGPLVAGMAAALLGNAAAFAAGAAALLVAAVWMWRASADSGVS